MDYSKKTLGELISSTDETIRRNAMSILKQLQKNELEIKEDSGVINKEDRILNSPQ